MQDVELADVRISLQAGTGTSQVKLVLSIQIKNSPPLVLSAWYGQFAPGRRQKFALLVDRVVQAWHVQKMNEKCYYLLFALITEFQPVSAVCSAQHRQLS